MGEQYDEYMRAMTRRQSLAPSGPMVKSDEAMRQHIGASSDPEWAPLDYLAARYAPVREGEAQPFIMLGNNTWWWHPDEGVWRGYGI
jgi:hypothetical protein